jgi:hypothetical protein
MSWAEVAERLAAALGSSALISIWVALMSGKGA